MSLPGSLCYWEVVGLKPDKNFCLKCLKCLDKLKLVYMYMYAVNAIPLLICKR